jgi:formylglycine-generating enzyme required for sulfatase activity
MIEIKGGKFTVDKDDEMYKHISSGSYTADIQNFKISLTEVTQKQFEYVMGVNPSFFKYCDSTNNSYNGKDDATSYLPVEQVNWYHAITYCNKLSILEGKDICYTIEGLTTPKDWASLNYEDIPTALSWRSDAQIPTKGNTDKSELTKWNYVKCNFGNNGYRLPTSTEWEYAARGGKSQTDDSTRYAGSKDNIDEVAWYKGNSYNYNNDNADCAYHCKEDYGTKPVATKKPNELGIYDMTGNVDEWCWNWNTEAFPKSTPSGEVQPEKGANRVIRGGSWRGDEGICHISSYSVTAPEFILEDLGFRVAASK